MVRLIDADALIDDVQQKFNRSYLAMDFAKKVVDKQPVVDAVPIIKCKDCKYFTVEYGDNGAVGHSFRITVSSMCTRLWSETDDYRTVFGVNGDDYCSFAERKEHE